MKNKKFNKDLLKEEVSKFKMMSEYSFYEDRSEPELDNDEEIILGSQIFNEEEEEDPFGDENEETEGEEEVEGNEEEETEDEGEVESVVYDTLTVLNTRKSHGVKGPTKTRIVFHMGIHDVGFEQLS